MRRLVATARLAILRTRLSWQSSLIGKLAKSIEKRYGIAAISQCEKSIWATDLPRAWSS